MNYKDYYKTLGVAKSATEDEIKSAYRKLAKQYHPDKNAGHSGAEAKFKEINEAYEVLGDTEKRRIYDTYGAEAASGRVPPGGGGYAHQGNMGDFSDFFQTLFGGGFGGRGGFGGFSGNPQDIFGQSGFQRQAPDIEGTLSISLAEAFHGTTRTVGIGEKSLEVSIPRGARDGQKMRLRGQAPGGANVLLTLKLEKDPIFKLENDDLRVVLDVPAPIAVVGGTVQAMTLEGRGEVNIPPGSQSGRVLRLRGQGWHKKDGSRGDALLEIRIVVPQNPSKAELELWTKLAESQ
ncbi:MAG: DnaJ C-terminal domain-containing protein [Deinococcales bacterium]